MKELVLRFCLKFSGADRSYKKRRRGGSESNDLEDRLESLILKVGEKVIFKIKLFLTFSVVLKPLENNLT